MFALKYYSQDRPTQLPNLVSRCSVEQKNTQGGTAVRRLHLVNENVPASKVKRTQQFFGIGPSILGLIVRHSPLPLEQDNQRNSAGL